MPVSEVLVASTQVGRKGSSSRKWVGLEVRFYTRNRHDEISLFTDKERGVRLPVAWVKAFWVSLNIPLSPSMAEVVIFRMLKSCLHLITNTLWDLLRMAEKSARTFDSRFGVILSRCLRVSRSHISTIFLVDQAASPCRSFFANIGYFYKRLMDSLERNTVSIMCKRV